MIHADPIAGKILDRVAVPSSNVTSCAFGGPDLDTLYITSSRAGVDPALLAAEPHAGGLFKVVPGVRGVPAAAFVGNFG